MFRRSNDESSSTENLQSLRSVVLEEALSWVKLILFVVALAVFITQFVIVNAAIPTGSMESVIMPNDRIIAFRLSYVFSDPARFDIIIFRYPGNDSLLYVKRIIGLPGETISIIDGMIFINDDPVPLHENFLREPMRGDYGPFVVPAYSYFVLGDNRGNSEDSRAWDNPFVHYNMILGRAVFRYYRGIGLLR